MPRTSDVDTHHATHLAQTRSYPQPIAFEGFPGKSLLAVRGSFELWYTYDNVSSDLMDLSLFVAGEKRSHWQLLAKLLSRLPNLRFLSVELNDYPEPSCDSEEKEEEQDKQLRR